MSLIANARMYSVTPASKAAWTQLFSWVLARSRVDADLIAWLRQNNDFLVVAEILIRLGRGGRCFGRRGRWWRRRSLRVRDAARSGQDCGGNEPSQFV